jgi:hypothetical protein
MIGLLGLLTSVVGIPLAYYLARRGRQRPDLRAATRTNALFYPDDGITGQGLRMTFGNDLITNVNRCYVAIWNHRGDSVQGSDIVPSDPLRVDVAQEERILQTSVVSYSRPQILPNVSISELGNSALVQFDFLDAGDGFLIEVIYEGVHNPELVGTVRGAAVALQRNVDLDPQILARMWGGRLNRLRAGVGRYATPLFALIAGLVWLGGIVFLTEFWREPEIVNVREFNLGSLRGQKDFAKEVSNVGLNEVPWWLIALPAFPFLFILSDGTRSYRRARRSPPRYVARHIVQSNTDDGTGDSGSPARPGAPASAQTGPHRTV